MGKINASVVLSVNSLTGELCSPPKYQHPGDAAMDCRANLDQAKVTVHEGQVLTVDLGFSIRVPDGHVLFLLPRSGIGKRQVIIPNSPGTIDRSYSDNVKVMLHNLTEEPFVIHNDDRICQMLLIKVDEIQLDIVSELPPVETTRTGGLGSSGLGNEAYRGLK